MVLDIGVEVAVEVLERQIEQVKTDTQKVECEIAVAAAAVQKVEVELSEVVAELQSPSLSADEKAALSKREERLSKKEEQLRTNEQQLRTKEQQLRTKEQQLRTEKDKQIDRLKLTGFDLYLERAGFVESPSQTSLKREQLDTIAGPLIINWRPTMDIAAGQLPELIAPVFAKAVELVADGTEVDEASIDTAAKLCCIGADIYVNEAGLTKAVRGLLQPYLEDENAVTIGSGFAANKLVSPDWALGDSPKNPSNLFLIVEAKPGIGGSGDPNFQGANYLLHFWRQRTESIAFRNTYCPAFLLEVVGPHVRLSAMAWLDRVTIFPLTPLLNLLAAHPVTDRLLMPVARMLAALRMGVRELAAAHVGSGTHTAPAALQQPVAASKRLALPWPIAMNSRYDAASALRLARHKPTYYVRLAGSGDGEGSGGGDGEKAVAVKLCRKYGLAAHKAWAHLDLAPQVLREDRLPGGWQLVEMEWLPKPEWQRLSDLQGGNRGEARGAVEEALKLAHSTTGMVHGDVRPANCLVRRDPKAARSWQDDAVAFATCGQRRIVLDPEARHW